MIIEDERHLRDNDDQVLNNYEVEYDDFDGNIVRSLDHDMFTRATPDLPGPFAQTLRRIAEVNNSTHHRALREDLMHHLYDNFPHYNKETFR
jgi:hypothetical protein